MMDHKETLYAKDAKGQLRSWTIEVIDFELIRITYGLIFGKKQVEEEFIGVGLAGRTVEEQVLSRFNSRINNKLKSGYVKDVNIAETNERVNLLGFKKPMLAAKYDPLTTSHRDMYFGQYKLDGHRCLVKNENGVLHAYSRNGKPINTLPEILSELDIPEGMTVDGELYVHGVPLQTITSWVKRRQENTAKIRYHMYDIIADEPYEARYNRLLNVPQGLLATVLPTNRIDTRADAHNELVRAVKLGYEGLILRDNKTGYEAAKRSKSLLKYKSFLDEEFEITNIIPSKQGWARMVCKTDCDKRFVVTAPGSMDEKYYFMINPDAHIGKMLTVKFQKYTIDGIPFHPVALQLREDI